MTQAATKDVPSFKDKPHAVLRIINDKGDVRYSVTVLSDDGNYSARYEPDTEKCEVVAKHANYNSAQAQRVALNRKAGTYKDGTFSRQALALPDFLPAMPRSPRERRDLFLSLDIEQQEEVLYALTVATGRPIQQLSAWLFVHEYEIEHIDPLIFKSARAELDLRIAKKMIGQALASNGPATITPTLYLTKVFCGWSETGTSDAPATQVDLDAAKSLFEDLTVVETHRDQSGKTVEPPTVLQLVREKRDQKAG